MLIARKDSQTTCRVCGETKDNNPYFTPAGLVAHICDDCEPDVVVRRIADAIMRGEIPCQWCYGVGLKPNSNGEGCWHCGGNGIAEPELKQAPFDVRMGDTRTLLTGVCGLILILIGSAFLYIFLWAVVPDSPERKSAVVSSSR